MTAETGQQSSAPASQYFPGKMLSDFAIDVLRDRPVDDFLRDLRVSDDIVRTSMRKTTFEPETSGDEACYRLFYVLAKDPSDEPSPAKDIAVPTGFKLHLASTADAEKYGVSSQQQSTLSLTGIDLLQSADTTDYNKQNYWDFCYGELYKDLKLQFDSSPAVKGLVRYFLPRFLSKITLTGGSLVTGVEYRCRRQGANALSLVSSQLFYSQYFTQTGDMIKKHLDQQYDKGSIPPPWMFRAVHPSRSMEVAKEMAISILANMEGCC